MKQQTKACWKCGSGAVKNGKRGDVQCYKCESCGLQFTRDNPKGHSARERALAVLLYCSGLSMRASGRVVGVTSQSVMRWVRAYAHDHVPPASGELPKHIEIDEMWHFIQKKHKNAGYGKFFAMTPDASWPGTVVIAVKVP